MTNFFGLNFNLNFGMGNMFMPSWYFPNFNFFSSFQMPFFNMYSQNFYSPSLLNTSIYDYTPSKSTKLNNTDTFIKTKNTNNTTTNNKANKLSLDDYNETKGKKLADIALKNRSKKGFTKKCAKYVKNDIEEAGLGPYMYGHAYQMPSILRRNPNFKEISPDAVDVKDLPAGCVLVYDRGTQGYSTNYGHTEITTGDGRAVSDGITNNLYRKPTTIFIPV